MSNPPISGPMNEPHPDQYEPRTITAKSPLVEQTKEMAEWMRNRGFRCQALVVTKERIEIVGLVDDFSRAARAAARSSSHPPDPLMPTWGD